MPGVDMSLPSSLLSAAYGIARTIRMYSLSTSAFEKTLEGFNQNQHYVQQNYQQPQQQNVPPTENNINGNNNQ